MANNSAHKDPQKSHVFVAILWIFPSRNHTCAANHVCSITQSPLEGSVGSRFEQLGSRQGKLMKTLKTHCCWSYSLLSGDYSVSGNINIYSVYSACIANDFTYLMVEQMASVSICTFVKKILYISIKMKTWKYFCLSG